MLLVNGKRHNDLPKMIKASLFELVNATYENPHAIIDGKPFVRKNKTFKIPTVFTRFNKEINQTEEYRYAIQEIPVNTGKESYVRYIPDRIVLLGTQLVVKTNQPDLYEFMRKSPWIEGNGNTRVLFREINPQTDAMNRLEREKLRAKAIRLIIDDNDSLSESHLRRILTAIGDNGDAYEMEIVKEKLLAFVDSKDESKGARAFLKFTTSKDTEIKALINDLANKGFIAFNKEKIEWQWGEKVKEKGAKILQVPPGKNEQDWLIDEALRNEALIKSFQILNKKSPVGAEVPTERTEMAKRLKEIAKELNDTTLARGIHLLSDEKLKEKVAKCEAKLKESVPA